MKQSISILLTTALAICPLLGEENARPGKGKADGSFFKSIDKDGDKAISKEEAGERWERMSKLDKDSDGKVTLQEMAAARPGAGERPGPGEGPGKGGPGEMFKRADKNNDGKISKDEVPAEAWNRLGRLDKNGDDAVSAEEAKAARPDGPGAPGGPGKGEPGKGGPGEMLKRADRNGDGNISKDEVPEEAWTRLGRLDKDSDGVVSKEEMAAGMAAMRGGKGKGGPPQGGPGATFSRFDKDNDGKLSESEVPAEMWGKLRKADTDADGVVSKEELEKVYKDRKDYAPASA